MGKIRMAVAGTAVAGLAVIALPASAQAGPTASYSDCPKGDICFYTGKNGTGRMCNWEGNDSDWRRGAIRCSWSGTRNVRSVYNNGYDSGNKDVAYYVGANYKDSNGNPRRIGCTKVGKQGNLAGTYKLRSHKWIRNC
jgi:Peptidase inhibitor family I36